MSGKYEPLTRHLRGQAGSTLPMTFGEIERIIDARLPASAHKHPAWWSNNPDNSVMTKAWLAAGWMSSNVDIPGRKLTFRRAAPKAAGPQPAAREPSPDKGEALQLRGMSEETMKWLTYRAEAEHKTASEVAAEIVATHVKPTVAERLAMLDRLREEIVVSPDIDVVAMIRADRDSR